MSWLYLTHLTVNGEPREYIEDAHLPQYESTFTSCRRPQHYPADQPPARQRIIDQSGAWRLMPMLSYLDCPCDIACPRCESRPGMFCHTLDGGGMSGGGFRTRWHAVRIKASPACQGVLDGSRTSCEWGWHPWHRMGTDQARCLWCGATEPLHDPAGEYEERQRFAAEQRAAARAEAEREAGVVHLSTRRGTG